ncbi:MAG: hypothetical protein QQN63_05385 [Nitrosopumilus sp.]
MKKISKKERKEAMEFVENHVWHILKCANLSHFMVQFAFGTAEGNKEFKGTKPAHMTMETDHEYLLGSLMIKEDWFFLMWRAKDYNSLLAFLCHEISHILTSELPDKMKVKYSGEGRYYQERLTEHVGRFVYRLYSRFMDVHNVNFKTGEINAKKKVKH